jgi:hypothetical protein
MTTKLTKAESAKLAELRTALENAALAYNAARNELISFRDEIHDKIETYIGNKSDKWQEGERGAAFQEWCDAWTEDPGDEAEESIPEYPEEPAF